MTQIDLFSGIGGFALAAQANGIETVCLVEKDQRCRDFLSKAWPGVPIYDDVKTFDGTQWTDAYLLTAGVPCQPASRAGKQRGAADDRWLWPQALRILGQVRPAWCLFENPPGIGDVGLAGILAGVEAHDYQVRVFGIPACAVGAPHRRMRYWIVGKRMADSGSERRQQITGSAPAHEGKYAGRSTNSDNKPASPCQGDVADTRRKDDQELEGPEAVEGRRTANVPPRCTVLGTESGVDHTAESRHSQGPSQENCQEFSHGRLQEPERRMCSLWSDYVWVPCADGKLRRAPGDSFGLVDGLHRSVLGALGNSIVWLVAAEIIRAMIQAD